MAESDRHFDGGICFKGQTYFSGKRGIGFAKVLLLEMRRMRKVGCTVVITARLDSQMVDVMLSMRRMGPNVRLYLVTQTPEDARLMPMILKLQEVGVEVGYVKPLPL